MADIPTFFDKTMLMKYDFNVDDIFGSEIDESYHIKNLSIPEDQKKICKSYLKSILLGYNHTYIQHLLSKYGTHSNICLPLVHKWEGSVSVNNMVILSNPGDVERICKRHIKKAPIFTSFLNTSIISTTDNDDWKEQRQKMNMAFIPKLSLQKIFPISQKRASECLERLRDISEHFTKEVNMSDFFLQETQAQLQVAMFGFSSEFEENTNKRIRNAFAGIETEYVHEFSQEALQEALSSDGPLSKMFHKVEDREKALGNMLIFAFAGHDTTGHTLTWLLYELCKQPTYQIELQREIDEYWKNHSEETYSSFKELPFMTKCITETLRLWPALANGTYRELEEDEHIIGIDGEKVFVPKGTYVQIMNWTRHRDSELWGEDVDIFNPHREFQPSEIWNYEGFNSYNVSSERYSPFTYGPRNCIGKNFSHMEMRLILLHIFKHFTFELTDDQKETIHDPNYKGINTFTMGPQDIYNPTSLGMYVHIIPRMGKL